jgi:outer membrane lipoprotein-sorting protein
MKKILVLMLAVLAVGVCKAEDAGTIITKVIANYSQSKSFSATYSAKSSQGASAGSITMMGNKFRILSNELKCWYDGKTQWAYSPATGEVNVTNPSAEELQMTNPYLAAMSFKNNYNATLVASGVNYVIKLLPKRKNAEISQAYLTISRDYKIQKATFTQRNRSVVSVVISKYKSGGRYSGSTFVFNKKYVPKGAQVVDLR